VQQGYLRSHAPHHLYSEAVLVDFDNSQIPLEILIEVHLRTHASTSMHSMRNKYRSAIYIFNDNQSQICRSVLKSLQSAFGRPVITQVLQVVDFELSMDRYRNYYKKDPGKPFCVNRIDPKLAILRRNFSSYMKQCVSRL